MAQTRASPRTSSYQLEVLPFRIANAAVRSALNIQDHMIPNYIFACRAFWRDTCNITQGGLEYFGVTQDIMEQGAQQAGYSLETEMGWAVEEYFNRMVLEKELAEAVQAGGNPLHMPFEWTDLRDIQYEWRVEIVKALRASLQL